MNAKALLRAFFFCAAGIASAHAVEAKGSLGVSLTIVSSCATSGASVYKAVAANPGAFLHSDVAMNAGCTSDTAYTVSASASRDAQAVRSTSGADNAGAGDIVVTLTY